MQMQKEKRSHAHYSAVGVILKNYVVQTNGRKSEIKEEIKLICARLMSEKMITNCRRFC